MKVKRIAAAALAAFLIFGTGISAKAGTTEQYANFTAATVRAAPEETCGTEASDTQTVDFPGAEYLNADLDTFTAWDVFSCPDKTPYEIVEHNSRMTETQVERNWHYLADYADCYGKVPLQAREQLKPFEWYYCAQHSFYGQKYTYSFYKTDEGYISTSVPQCDNAAQIQNVVNSIPVNVKASDSDMDRAKKIAKAVDDFITYDMSYATVPVDTALAAKRGVCYHYAHCVYVLLNVYGIPAKTVSGKCKGTSHEWVAALIDGKQYYIETTDAEIFETLPDKYVR